LNDGGIRTVVWAAGYRPDYSWLEVPVLDRKGRICHDGGIVPVPGMYVMGLPFMRRRKSSFIDGAGDDAADLVAHMSLALHSPSKAMGTQTGTPRAAKQSWSYRLAATLKEWWVARMTRRHERLASAELHTLSDRKLGGIGVNCAQIGWVAPVAS
jgi:hypothetical protein